jgi:uncharacterized protein YecT (DUF1311 family)
MRNREQYLSKFQTAWERLRVKLTQEANASGEMQSLSEHTWTTRQAKDTLAHMDELEQELGLYRHA